MVLLQHLTEVLHFFALRPILRQLSHVHFSEVALHRFLNKHLISFAGLGALRLAQRTGGREANGDNKAIFDQRMHENLLRLSAEPASENSVPSEPGSVEI